MDENDIASTAEKHGKRKEKSHMTIFANLILKPYMHF